MQNHDDASTFGWPPFMPKLHVRLQHQHSFRERILLLHYFIYSLLYALQLNLHLAALWHQKTREIRHVITATSPVVAHLLIFGAIATHNLQHILHPILKLSLGNSSWYIFQDYMQFGWKLYHYKLDIFGARLATTPCHPNCLIGAAIVMACAFDYYFDHEMGCDAFF